MADELAADGDVDGCLLLVTSDHPHLSTRQAKTIRSKFDIPTGAPSFIGASTRRSFPQPVNSSCQDSEKHNCHNQALGCWATEPAKVRTNAATSYHKHSCSL